MQNIDGQGMMVLSKKERLIRLKKKKRVGDRPLIC